MNVNDGNQLNPDDLTELEESVTELEESVGSISIQDRSMNSTGDGSVNQNSPGNSNGSGVVSDGSPVSNPNPVSPQSSSLSSSSPSSQPSSTSRVSIGNSGISNSETTGSNVSDNPQMLLEILHAQRNAMISDPNLDPSALSDIDEQIKETMSRMGSQKQPFASISIISKSNFVCMQPIPKPISYDVKSNSGIAIGAILLVSFVGLWYYLKNLSNDRNNDSNNSKG